MYTDPISDMLTRIRNAQMVKKTEIVLPYSKLKFNIASLLEKEGWLGKVETLDPILAKNVKAKNRKDKDSKFKQLKIKIKYNHVKSPNGDHVASKPKISSIKRISKPGRRIYVGKDEMPIILNNYGIAVISTPKGLMSNKQAKKEGVGGEVICEIY